MLKYVYTTPEVPSKSSYVFKIQYSFDRRVKKSAELMSKNKNIIPIIIEKSDASDIAAISKEKSRTCMKKDLTIGQVLIYVRRNIQLDEFKTIYLFVTGPDGKEVLPATQDTLETIYNKYKDVDGFLYFTYCAENTFG